MPDGQMPDEARLVALIPDLNRLARRLVRDRGRAEDLTQEALARVWAQIAGGAGIADLRPYLMEAARNLARRPDRPMVDLDAAPEPSVGPDAEARLHLRDVVAALTRLSASDRRLILGAAVGGRSYAELAQDENLPLGTVMSRIARIRARLRREAGQGRDGARAAPPRRAA